MSEKKEYPPALGDPFDHPGPDSGLEHARDHPEEALDSNQASDKPLQDKERRNDSGLGSPDFEPDSEQVKRIDPVSREEINQLRQEQEEFQRQFEEKILELEKTGIRIPRFFYSFMLWSLIFAGSLIGLLLLSQGIRLASQISVLAFPWNLLTALGALFFLSLIIMAGAKALKGFLVLKKHSKIDLKTLNALARRRRFRYLAEKKKEEAREVLKEYLREYPADDVQKTIPGLDREAVDRLRAHKKQLLEDQGWMEADQWLKKMDETFARILDNAARKRTRTYIRTVGLGTAASPVKFIDQFIVLYASLRLISELMVIYNLKPAPGQSATILARAIIQAYLGGVIGEQAEAGFEAFSDYYEEIYGEVTTVSGISAASEAARKIMPKMGEGALNSFLIWRLARQARKMLRPL
ncbi:DUF697 domain-containing protein [Desulfonatronovibrio hydrogenovorans]|uniref:DUF697 domain-containing protein n=1 Tax=Desulfonatronovibrio hydrogenovorans TaxID=53245 RepID=UPI000490A47A|nr:DUF697 domain-containing protein [Desulfonatronovibrio hydrogenovorans]